MASATEVRDKEAAVFAAASTEGDTNLKALKKALAAIEKGTAGAFLQTSTAQVLKQLAVDSESLSDFDRDAVVSFLSSDAGYEPQSGQITGILKQMGDTMQANLDDLVATEEEAKKTFGELTAAKTKEVE